MTVLEIYLKILTNFFEILYPPLNTINNNNNNNIYIYIYIYIYFKLSFHLFQNNTLHLYN